MRRQRLSASDDGRTGLRPVYFSLFLLFVLLPSRRCRSHFLKDPSLSDVVTVLNHPEDARARLIQTIERVELIS